MIKIKANAASYIRRIPLYLLGLFLVALGIVLCTKCGLGISPISLVPYVLNQALPLSFGTFTFLLHIVNILIQYIIIGKRKYIIVAMQIPVAIVLGLLVDLLKSALAFQAVSLPLKILVLALSILSTALGMVLMFNQDLVQNPPDGVVKEIAAKTGKKVGTIKIFYDISLLVISMILSLIFFRGIVGVGFATLASALLVGKTLNLLKKLPFLNPGRQSHELRHQSVNTLSSQQDCQQ